MVGKREDTRNWRHSDSEKRKQDKNQYAEEYDWEIFKVMKGTKSQT